MALTQQQQHWRRFYNDFGYVRLPGLFREEADWISEEFEKVFQQNGITHDGTKRTGCGYLVESSERLCTLLDDDRLDSVFVAILGEEYNFLGSAGELYVGDGMWHPDGVFHILSQAKLAMYLDPLTPETGSLRVVPGSHLQNWEGNLDTQALWGISDYEMPYASYRNTPGDVLIFNLNTLHNSLGGGYRRRMLNMGLTAHAETPEQVTWLKRAFSGGGELYSDIMLKTASPRVMSHLRQPLELSGQLSAPTQT